MSVKRRRGIGIRKWLVSALKDYAKREGLPSHTAAANKILRGKLEPIRSYERYKDGGDHTKQGISMQEELWLALKSYSQQRGKDENDTQVACKVIVGKIPPIPGHCIEEGGRLARARELERAKDLKPEETKEERPQKKKAKKKAKAFSKKAIKKAEKEIAEKHKGSDDPPCTTGLPPGMSSDEFLDAVKKESQEQGIIEARAEKKLDEHGRTLSKGEPLDEAERQLNRKIDPDADHFGGVFNI